MNNIWCLIAFALLFGSVYTNLSCINCETMVKYRQSLDNELAEKNKQIIKERINIYYMGAFIGLVLALVYYFISKDYNWCIFASIIVIVNAFYYVLAPKSLYMIEVLKTDEQRQLWTKVYRMMQFRYVSGILLGAGAYYTLGYGLKS